MKTSLADILKSKGQSIPEVKTVSTKKKTRKCVSCGSTISLDNPVRTFLTCVGTIVCCLRGQAVQPVVAAYEPVVYDRLRFDFTKPNWYESDWYDIHY